ncbi:cyclic nucleotide-gated channel cone photoreceptor subunit alpha-like [Mytilus californianus]|uniref:cyclic nucleotide-gated channel cone photoreceptor subunit alpha-like n=1 Tax=Mytilus californianus TaxID=6549 RepID=UPI0022484A86|nr:cyclic nucleotide-gated channel cone photoreceptor subunit alpha-like [Mytilus californianus]
MEIRRKSEVVEKDPFLDKFTVTGRAFEKDEDDHFECSKLFTKKFWKELVFDPADFPYYYWSMLAASIIMYNIVFIILRITFHDQVESPHTIPIWFAFDYISDFFYLCDMFVKSRIGFLESGLLVKDVGRLTNVYLKSWMFKADILSVLPTDFFYFLQRNTAFRLNRIIKIWRMMEFFRLAQTHTNFPNLFGVARLILYIIIIIHWNACFYFSISRYLGFGSDGWVYPDPTTEDYGNFFKQYVTSFYWSCLTLTTIGDTAYPETVMSYCFCIVDSLVGVLIFATIFGNVGALINGMDAARTEYQAKVDSVKRYMELRGVFGELQVRVIKWFDYTWNNKQSFDDKEVLFYLPEKLRAEISVHVHLGTLRRVAIFQDSEPGLLVELVLKLRLQVFSPGDYICRKGDIGKDMYIVKRGKLQVVSDDGKVIFVTLSDGSVFGEISVLNISGNKTGNRRTASVRSVGYSDLFCLSKRDLWDALEEYPEAKKNLMHKGQQLLRKDNLLDEDAARKEERRLQNLDKRIELIHDAVDDLQCNVKRLAKQIQNQQNPGLLQAKSKSRVMLKPQDQPKEESKDPPKAASPKEDSKDPPKAASPKEESKDPPKAPAPKEESKKEPEEKPET